MTPADEVQRDDEFTDLEIEVIFGLCWGGPPYWRLGYEEIGTRLGITSKDAFFGTTLPTIVKKTGMGTHSLRQFAREALNNELRRRRLSPGDSGAAMEG